MPVGRPTTRRELSAVLIALAGVAIAALIAVAMLRVAKDGDVEVRLGSSVFDAGRTDRIAADIAERGPILYADVAGGDRDIYLNHLGGDPSTGWLAFEARPPGVSRDCTLLWVTDEDRFSLLRVKSKTAIDPRHPPEERCSEAHWPADGAGLTPFPVRVERGRIVVDLNADQRSEPLPTTTTDSVIESGIPRTTATTGTTASTTPSTTR